MSSIFKIGTRESELAVWQATQVQDLLREQGQASELVYIKSEGDIDLQTPLYEMGVQGIFTRSLDIALLSGTIDIAVHSMKDVPTQLPRGIVQAAVLKRGNYKDLFVINSQWAIVNSQWSIVNGESQLFPADIEAFLDSLKTSAISPFTIHHSLQKNFPITIATSSIRRKAQWLNRYPDHTIDNLRGNVNTRMRKVGESNWHGAIFAAAGLERINLRPANSIELDWMLPAPAQGAVMVVCRDGAAEVLAACASFNDEPTATCAKIERDFLRELLGGCSTPISALAQIENGAIHFKGNILSVDGKQKVAIEKTIAKSEAEGWGSQLANELLKNGGQVIADGIRSK
jgi:hydroxymethylbilane synthase